MNIGALLNKRTLLVSTSQRLNTLLRKSYRVDITSKTLLLEKKKKLSEVRAKTFAALGRQKEDDGGGLFGIGAGIGGGASLLRGMRGKPKVTRGIGGKVRGLGKLSKTNVVLNTAFTAADFMGRKKSGQTNLQAGVGAGAGLLGGLGGFSAGAKIGGSIGALGGPLGIAVGGLIGGAIGGFAGSSLASGAADRATGVTGSEFRRKELERQEITTTQRTEFTAGLDTFDRALDKFRKYDEDQKEFILRATGRDRDNQALKPTIFFPFGRGNASQSDVDEAYRRGFLTGVYRTVGGVLIGATVIVGGKLVISRLGLGVLIRNANKFVRGSRSVNLMGAGKGMRFPKNNIKDLFNRGKNIKIDPLKPAEVIKKQPIVKKQFKVTKSRNKVRNRKILRGQDKVTFSDKFDINEIRKITGVKINEIKKSMKILERFNNKMNKTINPKKKTIQKKLNLFKKNKTNSNKGPDLSSLGGGDTIAFVPELNPYLGTINSIKAYSELTV